MIVEGAYARYLGRDVDSPYARALGADVPRLLRDAAYLAQVLECFRVEGWSRECRFRPSSPVPAPTSRWLVTAIKSPAARPVTSPRPPRPRRRRRCCGRRPLSG